MLALAATASPLSLPDPSPVLVSVDHVHDLITENTRLQRDLTSLRLRCAAFERSMAAPVPVCHVALPGGPAVVLSTGAVQQFVTRCIETPDGTEYVSEWRTVAPVPDTPAAIVAAAECEAAGRYGCEVLS